jgi:serine/threonine protein kinase
MQKLQHPYICKLHDHFETSKDIYLVQEYVSGISLCAYMNNKGKKALPIDQAKFFIK